LQAEESSFLERRREQNAQQLVKERTGAKKRKGDNDENI
jgi:hypothetical protein